MHWVIQKRVKKCVLKQFSNTNLLNVSDKGDSLNGNNTFFLTNSFIKTDRLQPKKKRKNIAW